MPKRLFFLALLFLTCSLPVIAQDLELKISNPQPRLGEAFTVSLSMDFFNEQMSLQLQQHTALEVGQPSFTDRSYSRTLSPTKAGNYQIGPFRFVFNGKTYTTNTVSINVIEPLADQEDIWLRQVRFGGEEFLILEQKIRDLQGITYTRDAFDKGTSDDFEKAFASLLEQPAEGISMKRRFSSTPAVDADKTGSASLGYSLQIYRIEKKEDFAGMLQLRAEHFQNLPPYTSLPFLVLR